MGCYTSLFVYIYICLSKNYAENMSNFIFNFTYFKRKDIETPGFYRALIECE